ncbi:MULTISPECIES: DUF3727 domain-containing protein [Spirulina sp. CCY15215]|uniref:DUF3727 domain-containing protein n=1 Tax=Spirulina sp. CCY15215 TaxID=2767591 RepID=UPI001951CEA5|nr:DUF3727 domain-containing protein [Spirulina major]
MPSFPKNRSDPPRSLTLTDEAGQSLCCSIEHSFIQDGATYFLLLPLDTPITIIAWESDLDDAEAIWVEDSAEIALVFDDAKAVLAEQNLTLNQAAYTLTVSGELPEADEDDILTLEIETETDQLESEQFQFLTHFYHEEQEYEIYTPLDPLLLFARQTPTGDVEILSLEELQSIQPQLQELLVRELDREI